MKKLQFLFLAAVLMLGAVFQINAQKNPAKPASQPASLNNIYGRVENGVYINDVFGFSLTPPRNWQVIEADAMEEVGQLSRDDLKGDNVRYNQLLEENFKVEKLLKGFVKKPLGTPENAFLGVSSQKIPANAAPLKANMDVTRQTLLASKLSPIVSAPVPISFGEVKAMWMDTDVEEGGMRVKQRLYVCLHKGYYINVVLTYVDTADLPLLEAAIKTLKFK